MKKAHHKQINDNFGISFEKFDYSFQDFLNLLSKIDINACNVHWNQQFQLIERRLKLDYIIDIKDSIIELSKIENIHNLKRTENIETLAHSGHHSKPKISSESQNFCGNISYTFEIRQNRPPYKSFYNSELEELVRQIYKVDFEMYNFDLKYL